ncbi:MAG: cell division protein FtsZ, partial [Verrucomicrobiales bacterium]
IGKIIGGGRAGRNALEHISRTELAALGRSAVHTNARILQTRSIETKILLGTARTHGLGTGGDPEVARVIAEDEFSTLKTLTAGADLVFIITGLGGGTGTGVAPLVARAAKESGALVLSLATLPFEFEGGRRHKQAQLGLSELKAASDAVICLPNQKVFKLVDANTSIIDAFQYTNELLAQGVRGIWEMLTRPGLINVDFAYLYSVVRGRHVESSFATAEAKGENRSREVIEKLVRSPLLEQGQSLSEADEILVSLVGGPDMTIADVNKIMELLNRHTEEARLIMGAAVDPAFIGKVSVTVIASKSSKLPAQYTQAADLGRSVTPSGQIDTNFFTESEVVRPPSRFVAPPPEATPEKTQEILKRQVGRGKARKAGQQWKQGQLNLEIISRGRFEKSPPTIHQGEDLDVPTYIRRGLPLN